MDLIFTIFIGLMLCIIGYGIGKKFAFWEASIVGFNEFLKNQQLCQGQSSHPDLMKMFITPKSRGIFGEKWLEVLLTERLSSKFFTLQHKFSTGVICDAVVFLSKEKKLSIDSKFSMENFVKASNSLTEDEKEKYTKVFHEDIKKRIKEISAKYILPSEGTVDFAFMFIPAEGIYYQTFIEDNAELMDYAYAHNVIVVSPSTLYTYLQFVLYGLQGYNIEKNSREFQRQLVGIIRDLETFDKEYDRLKDKLDQAKNNFDNVQKLSKKVQYALLAMNDISFEGYPEKFAGNQICEFDN
jgi:DNA recombination protein RmuC